ncbi:unnamed protein product [Dovyalis caffra]|uniref:Toprim domain-containing protein n=1 Tax=Dovyalis caffra TaxID=77055 RepID=A0AAV1SXU8_9ROSI|nr:unnamed protein product [Dovyalis caffra]
MTTLALSLTNQLCHFSTKVRFLFTNKNSSTPPPTTRLMSHVWSQCNTPRFPTLRSELKVDKFWIFVVVEANGNIKEVIEEDGIDDSDKVRVLMKKIKVLGINCDDSCLPGQYYHLLCPKCQGGKTMERSLSFNISLDEDFAMWRCFNAGCGWTGQAFADSRMTIAGVNKIFKVKSSKQITPEGIVLEPLGDKLIAYFSERMISNETLQRNAVMQMSGDKAKARSEAKAFSSHILSFYHDIIAFTYRQNGAIVGCKYRTMEKRFWQVEGEIDKLSVEEAGFRNCISVPGGAPQVVSAKDLPSLEKDRAYQYLWNSKEYLDKLSRIVLATDGDTSGQSLAEELARRLGKERCWLVRWPKKDDWQCFKDANEVLKCLGPAALKKAIQTAEKYEACQLHLLNQLVLLQGLPAEANHLQARSWNSLAQFFHLYMENAVYLLTPTSKLNPSLLTQTNGHSFSPLAAPGEDKFHGLDPEVKKSKLEILRLKLAELGIELDHFAPGQYNALICPMCKGGDSNEKSFSLFISADGYALAPFVRNASWNCFRAKCGWNGGTKPSAGSKSTYGTSLKLSKVKQIREITEQSLELEPLCDELVGYFKERLISAETLARNQVMQKGYGDRGQVAIAFTYRRNGVLVSCKYRDINKKFWQEKDTEKVFYGLDDIKGADEIIIVEGEMDKLAMEEAGFRNCVSVPDGAPPAVSSKELPPKQEASRIILATDGDPPGQALAEELARRLGRERCWRVKWPKKNKDGHFKDANEVLMFSGPLALRDVIENAELYPIRGLFNFSDYFPEIDAYYNRTLGYEFGVSTGWKALNEIYNIMPGELTMVTGVPNSGKSEWIDALLCNLNESVGWKFALCSMENSVRDHARKLLEKHMKKPFFDARYGESVDRMSAEELEEGKQWLRDTFYLIRCEDDALPHIKWVLNLARAAVLRHGVRGLVIDPYNELDHQRPPSMTETEYVSQMLTLVKRFAQHHACHVWFVAHPKQLQNWAGQPPNLYDISGSAHFVNKCDNGIVIHRNRDPNAGPVDQVQVCVRKVRNKVAGTIGDAILSYNRATGQFMDVDKSAGSNNQGFKSDGSNNQGFKSPRRR